MYFVYLIRSDEDIKHTYIGITSDIKKRLMKHNEGGSHHTAKHRPWRLITFVAFGSKHRAAEFEQYLKSGSGKAFAKRHLW